MKTTINIRDVTMREIKREAVRRGQTMAEVIETTLRSFVDSKGQERELPPLPEFSGGGSRIDVANRDTLNNVMEG